MCDRPAKPCDWRLGVHPLQHVEQVMHRAVVVPVERRGHAARHRPAQHLIEPLLLLGRRIVVVVEAPGGVLANAVETQISVAEAHRQQLRQRLKILELAVAARRGQAVAHAQRHAAVAPELHQRPVVGNGDVVAAGVHHAGEAQRIERAEERARALDALRGGRARQEIEQVADGAVVAGDPAGRLVLVVTLDGEPRGKPLLGIESLVGSGAHEHAAVEKLYIDQVIGRGGNDLGLGRPPAFLELPLGPAAGDDEPASLRLGFRCGAETVERGSERARAGPVHLGGVGEPRADRVDVGVDQTRG